MTTAAALQVVQVVVGLGLVAYAVWLVAKRARAIRWRFPTLPSTPYSPGDDLRVLVDMAARLRDTGNVEAVKACQALIDELLLPKTPTT